MGHRYTLSLELSWSGACVDSVALGYCWEGGVFPTRLVRAAHPPLLASVTLHVTGFVALPGSGILAGTVRCAFNAAAPTHGVFRPRRRHLCRPDVAAIVRRPTRVAVRVSPSFAAAGAVA